MLLSTSKTKEIASKTKLIEMLEIEGRHAESMLVINRTEPTENSK